MWGEVVARCLSAYGFNAQRLGAGFLRLRTVYRGTGLHYGSRKPWWYPLSPSVGNTQAIPVDARLGAKALACTPSYALFLAEAIKDSGIKEEFQLKNRYLWS